MTTGSSGVPFWQQHPPSPPDFKSSSTTTTNKRRAELALPFLEGKSGEGGKEEAAADAAKWIRVRSSAAMHPAMYVPADGLVYCPIAKVRSSKN